MHHPAPWPLPPTPHHFDTFHLSPLMPETPGACPLQLAPCCWCLPHCHVPSEPAFTCCCLPSHCSSSSHPTPTQGIEHMLVLAPTLPHTGGCSSNPGLKLELANGRAGASMCSIPCIMGWSQDCNWRVCGSKGCWQGTEEMGREGRDLVAATLGISQRWSQGCSSCSFPPACTQIQDFFPLCWMVVGETLS